MHVINKTPDLTLFKQEAEWNAVENILTVEAQAQYSDIAVGAEFDYCFEMTNGNTVAFFTAKITSITKDNKNQKILKSGSVGKVSLRFNIVPTSLIQLLKEAVITVGLLKNRSSNIYLEKVLALEPVENNKQVVRWLKRIAPEDLSGCICFVARATEGDVLTGQDFNVLWNLRDIETIEKCNVKLVKVYNNKFRLQEMLLNRIPSVVFLKVKGQYPELLKHEEYISLNYSKHLMIGKRVDPK